MATFNEVVVETNPRRSIRLFTPFEFITCNALLLAGALYIDRGANLWSGGTNATDDPHVDEWSSIVDGPNFVQYGINLYRFKQYRRFAAKIWESETLNSNGDPWWKFAFAISEFNKNRKQSILTSSDRILDESMSGYRPRTSKLGGLPNISYILRKPVPLGTEFKCVVCPVTKIMTFLEIQRGKNGMKEEQFNRDLGATAGCCMRLANGVDQSHVDGVAETVKGDAWFGSVKAVCNLCNPNSPIKREAIFQVKSNSRGFPKGAILQILKSEPGGTSIVLKATDPDTETGLVAIGYKYNSKTVLFFVASEGVGSTKPGTPYKMRFPNKYGTVVIREVPRPSIISRFFEQSNCVDVHNQLRQYALRLEKNWVTCDPYFRLFCTLIGITAVDCFRLSNFHSILQSNGTRLTVQDEAENNFKGMYFNAGTDANNLYTMNRFTGILCKQLLLLAKRVRVPTVNGEIGFFLSPSRGGRGGEGTTANNIDSTNELGKGRKYADSQSSDVLEVSDNENFNGRRAVVVKVGDGSLVHVLDFVYDKNGMKHQAVRQQCTQAGG